MSISTANRSILANCVTGLLLLLILSYLLPVLSGYLPDGESGTLVFRGYNLAETSPFGVAAVIIPIMAIIIRSIGALYRAKEIVTAILAVASEICFLMAIPAAKRFLLECNAVDITFHFGLYVTIGLFAAIIVFCMVLLNLHHPISTYEESMNLCAELVNACNALEGSDEVGFGLFHDMLFWANEYAKQLALDNFPDFKSNLEMYQECGVFDRRHENLSQSKETFLADLDTLLSSHVQLSHIDSRLPNDETKLRFACYLSMYYALMV